jgi:phage shock protein PspC (stress-responsive transcriptional regulator)
MVEKKIVKKTIKEDVSKELKKQKTYKKLYLSKKDKMIAGVCGGLGEYFNIDPVLIRLAFVIFAIISFGFGVLIYLLAWIIIPERHI